MNTRWAPLLLLSAIVQIVGGRLGEATTGDLIGRTLVRGIARGGYGHDCAPTIGQTGAEAVP
jgi:hypothetical protein